MTLAALGATLALYRDLETAVAEVPVLRMLTLAADELARRARLLAEACPASLRPRLTPGESAVGGGAFPGAVLPTTLVSLDAGEMGPDGLALRLRVGDPAVIARVGDGRLLLDPRTLRQEDLAAVGVALTQALRE
jgi:L-seryl-tRNA(Ser) seleniumtransferase